MEQVFNDQNQFYKELEFQLNFELEATLFQKILFAVSLASIPTFMLYPSSFPSESSV